MLVETIQAELVRLQLHPVNLDVAAEDDRLVKLKGSLLQYWTIPATLDGQWLLGILEGLPDEAGSQSVMNAVCSAHVDQAEQLKSRDKEPALKLFDPSAHE